MNRFTLESYLHLRKLVWCTTSHLCYSQVGQLGLQVLELSQELALALCSKLICLNYCQNQQQFRQQDLQTHLRTCHYPAHYQLPISSLPAQKWPTPNSPGWEVTRITGYLSTSRRVLLRDPAFRLLEPLQLSDWLRCRAFALASTTTRPQRKDASLIHAYEHLRVPVPLSPSHFNSVSVLYQEQSSSPKHPDNYQNTSLCPRSYPLLLRLNTVQQRRALLLVNL